MTLSLNSDAEMEFLDAVKFYLDESTDIADQFIDVIERSFYSILETPRRYVKFQNVYRVKRVARFPYSIIYRLNIDEVRILAVAHDSREPNYWSSRR